MHLFANRNAVLCWCTIFFTSFQAISLIVLMPLRFQSVTGAGADSAALHCCRWPWVCRSVPISPAAVRL
jgi:hypothetical protein